MKFVEKKIKVKDKELKDLFRRLEAARMGMQMMAENAHHYGIKAWELAKKLHGIDIDKYRYCYEPKTETIEWKEFEDEKASVKDAET